MFKVSCEKMAQPGFSPGKWEARWKKLRQVCSVIDFSHMNIHIRSMFSSTDFEDSMEKILKSNKVCKYCLWVEIKTQNSSFFNANMKLDRHIQSSLTEYTFVCVCLHSCTHMCPHTHALTRMHSLTHRHPHMPSCTGLPSHTYAHMHSCIYMCLKFRNDQKQNSILKGTRRLSSLHLTFLACLFPLSLAFPLPFLFSFFSPWLSSPFPFLSPPLSACTSPSPGQCLITDPCLPSSQ